MIVNTTYSLDDVLLEPQRSNIKSRLDTSLKTKVSTNYSIDSPLMATNMSTITEFPMMRAMHSVGGVGVLHRFLEPYQRIQNIQEALAAGCHPVIASIGIGPQELMCGKKMAQMGADVILIDVAHGHSQQVVDQLKALKDYKTVKPFDVIVGNIVTEDAAREFLELGADGLRVGIGGGSRCLTRTVTGHGVPNLTAIKDVVYARDDYLHKAKRYVPVIIDGGIKTSGDIVKALYFGADVACLGNLLSGTDETPGELVTRDGKHFKKFYGMASKEAQDVHRGGMKNGTAAEGFSELVSYKGSVKPILEQLLGGIRSGLTYSGANNIEELRQKGKPVYLSSSARGESKIL